jgi:hypothetical protein
MLYSIFIYQTETGLPIWQQSFEKQMDDYRIQLFSSFFSAIQTFVKELVNTGDKGLKNIELGNFVIKITAIPKIHLEIIAIIDKEDEKPLGKVNLQIIKLLEEHNQLFEPWDGDTSKFDVLNLDILRMIQSEKSLLGNKSLIDGQSEILGSIVDRLPELEKNQRENCLNERTFLYKKFNDTGNILKKIEILGSIDIISQKLKDKADVLKITGMRKNLETELISTKQKIAYFLHNTKAAISKAVEIIGRKPLSELDFKDAYMNLYSFSTKLKTIGRDDLAEQYRQMAQLFIDKKEEEREQLSQALKNILNLPDEIDYYFPK